MKVSSLLYAVSLLVITAGLALAIDGTFEGAVIPSSGGIQSRGGIIHQTDSTYVLTPFESASIDISNVWRDNRHRAYYSGRNVNGCLLFDVSSIPDNSVITSMTLRCYLENAYASPRDNPIVDVYWAANDNWTRATIQGGSVNTDTLLVDNIPFTTYIPYYDFILDVNAHDWTIDLLDDRITLIFKNDVTYYSFVYFFGAYGAPAGPPPELTIVAGPASDLVVTLTPLNTPIQIPAGGGTFSYDAQIENTTNLPVSFDAWTEVILPNGASYGPLILRTGLSVPGGAVISRTGLAQFVPGYAPAGDYTYIGNVGTYPGNIIDSDGFQFSKLFDGDNSCHHNQGWALYGWDEPYDADISGGIPSAFSLLSASPNPFNPQTTLNFNLDEAGVVKLVIYDLQGREKAVLWDGWAPAGKRQAHFDASGYSSGVYFARLNSGNEISVCKLLLIK